MDRRMFIDPLRPGIIRWDDDPMTGIVAGVSAPDIVRAVNAHNDLVAALKLIALGGCHDSCPNMATDALEKAGES